MKWRTLRDAAGFDVEEPPNGSLRLVRWRDREPSSYSDRTPEGDEKTQRPIQTATPLSPNYVGDDNEPESIEPDLSATLKSPRENAT